MPPKIGYSNATVLEYTLWIKSKIKQLLQLCYRVLWLHDCVPNCPWILVDLVVISTLVCLVTEEVNGGIFNSARFLSFLLKVLEAVGLVPAYRENIEGNLTTN
jgi:hypothetical protein